MDDHDQTPMDRLRAAGYELDEDGSTVELGFSGTKHTAFVADPWEWLEAHEPDLRVVCSRAHRVGRGDEHVIASLWLAPTMQTAQGMPSREPWYASGHYRGPLAEWVDFRPGWLPLECPQHGRTFVSIGPLLTDLDSTRRKRQHDCADPATM